MEEMIREQLKDALSELQLLLDSGMTTKEALDRFMEFEDITEDEKKTIVKAFELREK
ncbi:hypothetical protein [Guptibacillus hwajinpoensis]|uniref:hypothetical protein n=1 Tax=Guptibacillus hwajinpoensis TaxID=208199 RepID=UPI00137922DC|nr:hypothetical protein [Alkalihalobacillus macyae]